MNLVKIELKKIFSSLSFLILMAVNVFMCALSVLLVYMISGTAGSEQMGMDVMSLMPKGYDSFVMLMQNSSDVFLLLSILMCIAIGGDFAKRTLQTQLTAGYSRMQVFASRYITMMIMYVVFLVVYILVYVGGTCLTLGFGTEFTGDIFVNMLKVFGLNIVMASAYIGIYIFMCFLTKSLGAAMGINLAMVFMVPSIFSMAAGNSKVVEIIYKSTPYGQSGMITPDIAGKDMILFFVVAIAYVIITCVASWLVFRKAELK